MEQPTRPPPMTTAWAWVFMLCLPWARPAGRFGRDVSVSTAAEQPFCDLWRLNAALDRGLCF